MAETNLSDQISRFAFNLYLSIPMWVRIIVAITFLIGSYSVISGLLYLVFLFSELNVGFLQFLRMSNILEVGVYQAAHLVVGEWIIVLTILFVFAICLIFIVIRDKVSKLEQGRRDKNLRLSVSILLFTLVFVPLVYGVFVISQSGREMSKNICKCATREAGFNVKTFPSECQSLSPTIVSAYTRDNNREAELMILRVIDLTDIIVGVSVFPRAQVELNQENGHIDVRHFSINQFLSLGMPEKVRQSRDENFFYSTIKNSDREVLERDDAYITLSTLTVAPVGSPNVRYVNFGICHNFPE